MQKRISIPMGIATLILASGMFVASAQTMHMKANDEHPFITPSAVDLRIKLRDLWQDHGLYTRNVILNIIDGLPGTDESVARLLRNQDDIGNLIKPVYGEDAGNKLTKLLREHIVLAADLLKAAKGNNDKDFNSVNTKWFNNADEISTFLSSANPQNWKLEDMKKMMHEHLKLTTQEAVARLKKDYKADIEAYDKTRAELLEMSDMLAAGVVKQFPDKFKN